MESVVSMQTIMTNHHLGMQHVNKQDRGNIIESTNTLSSQRSVSNLLTKDYNFAVAGNYHKGVKITFPHRREFLSGFCDRLTGFH